MFAKVVCWCEHDCCTVVDKDDARVLESVGIPSRFYDCEVCVCHEDLMAWDDATWD